MKDIYESSHDLVSGLPTAEDIISPNGELIAQRYDIAPILANYFGDNWQQTIVDVILKSVVPKEVNATDSSCREADPQQLFHLLITPGSMVSAIFPQLETLYDGVFLQAMQVAAKGNVKTRSSFAKSAHFISQFPNIDLMPGVLNRMDAHVDARPTLILALKASAEGGELVVSNDPNAKSTDEIDQNATVIHHIDGTIIAMPAGQQLPHYTREVLSGQRVVASVDYLRLDQAENDERLQEIDERIGNTAAEKVVVVKLV